MNQSNKITALYERLSIEDRDKIVERESDSIENQKFMLEEYARNNGFKNIVHYSDDGLSGRWFDRPAYMKMMEDIESSKVGVVIIKDLSRFGRAHIQVGQYIEEFRLRDVRLIALSEGVDSLHPETLEFVPFLNIMNEYYAKDCSKKIRAVFKSKGMAGKPTTSYPPYGYLKNPEEKYKWILDTEAAVVVRRIFQMTMEGKGPYQICCTLKDEKVPIPAYYLAGKGAGLHQKHTFPDPYNWHSTTVCGILKKKEYLGHTVNFKTRKHFNDKKSHYVDESQWTIFENTHEPIIDQETFDNVQRIRGNIKRRPDGWGYTHPLSGLMFCADCGGKLYVHRIYNGKDKPTAVCGNYAKGYDKVSVAENKCESGHRIDTATLVELIRDLLKSISDYAKTDKAGFVKSVQETLASQHTSEIKKQKKRLTVCKKRHSELELLFKKIYEDNALGKLPNNRYESLANDYGKEQSALDKEIDELEKTVGSYEDGSTRAKRFIELVNRYTDFIELTVPMLNEFVNKIVVHERNSKGKIEYTQKIEIHLNFIGEYLPPMLTAEPPTPEDEEELQKVLERRKKYRQNYLRRKESGKQQEYDKRYAEKKRAQIAANKASLFKEGAVLGSAAFAPVAVNQ